jgi:YbgC/YbaW family acyl-CoA thioester hydrolase
MPSPPPPPVIVADRIRWRDVDPVHIARYDAYVRLLEVGEEELFRAAGMDAYGHAARTGVWLPRKVMHVEYAAPARLGDVVQVVGYVGRLGSSSVTLHVDVCDAAGGRLLAAGQFVLVAAQGSGTLTKVALPDDLRRWLEPWVLAPDEARRRAAARVAGPPPTP